MAWVVRSGRTTLVPNRGLTTHCFLRLLYSKLARDSLIC